ncbi:MAG: hypothetical protein ACYC2T_13820 [Bacillota bacterium]
MFLTMAKFESKNLLRERMTAVMLVWPLVLGMMGRYLIDKKIVEGQVLGITAMILSLLAGYAYGAMAGFSLLDDRDDDVFTSIQVSQVSLNLYIWFKTCFVYLLAVLSGFIIVWLTGVVDLAIGDILLVSTLSALQVPIGAFLINAFARNKVEGFVTMKATGFLLLFPIAGFFFLDAKEWLFSIAPGHWAAKAVQFSIMRPQIDAGLVKMNLGFYQYIGIGILYNMLLIALAYSIFKRKNNL